MVQFVLGTDPALDCFALYHRGLSPTVAFPKLPHQLLPIGFDQREALAGDWKAGGRNKPGCFTLLVVSLLEAASVLWP